MLYIWDMFTRQYLKSLATATVFSRGEAYFLDDNVRKISRKDDTFSASVRGSYIYKVQLTLRATGAELQCNCPYDYEGICKHQVAFGLAVLDQYGPTLRAAAEPAGSADALEAALDATPVTVQLRFLAGLLRENPELGQQFLHFVAAPATPATDAETVTEETIGSISTAVYEKLSDLEFDDDLLSEYSDGYDDYEDYLYDEVDGMLTLADEAIAEVLEPYAQAVVADLRGRRLHQALRCWLGVYEGSQAAEQPQADEYDLFGDEGYPEHVANCWQVSLTNKGVYQLLETTPFAASDAEAALALLFERYPVPADIPAHFQPLLRSLAHSPALAARLRPLLETATGDNLGLGQVLLRVAEVLHDDALWQRTAEAFAPQDATLASQLLDHYRRRPDRPAMLRLLHQLWLPQQSDLMPYVLSYVSPDEDQPLYLAALELRCRSAHRIEDYYELQRYWSPDQRHEFVEERLALSQRPGVEPLFGAQLLAAEKRDAELLPYLLRYDWTLYRSVPGILTLAAHTHPHECMDAVMEQAEALLQDNNRGRGREFYQSLMAWLTALNAFPELQTPVALFAAHLYTEYSRLNALREELRKAQLVRTLKTGNQYRLQPPTPEDDQARALA